MRDQVSRHCGRKPARTKPTAEKAEVLEIAEPKYPGDYRSRLVMATHTDNRMISRFMCSFIRSNSILRLVMGPH